MALFQDALLHMVCRGELKVSVEAGPTPLVCGATQSLSCSPSSPVCSPD